MKNFFYLFSALLLIFYLASFSGCGVNPPCNNCGIDTIPHDTVPTDTVPTDTVPQDTVQLPIYYGIWDWIPYPPCIDAKITLTVDSFSNVNVSTYPPNLYGYYNPCYYMACYYYFHDDEQFSISGDTLYYFHNPYDDEILAVYAISSTGYICDTIDLVYLLPRIEFEVGIYVYDYTFIRRTN